jgi:CrcB protein
MSPDEGNRMGLVFVGGGVGAVVRALMLVWLSAWGTAIPVLLINLLGSLALGMVFALADEAGWLAPGPRLFLAVGLLGGFTTFSTFVWGTDVLLSRGPALPAAALVLASLAGGLLAVAAGLRAGRAVAALPAGRAERVLESEEGEQSA